MKVLRKAVRIVGVIWQGLGVLALVGFTAFLAWRIPSEREENRILREEVNLDDGPHVFWRNDFEAKVIRLRYDRQKGDFRVEEQWIDLRKRQSIPTDLEPLLAGSPETLAPQGAELRPERIAAVSDIHGQYNHFVRLLSRAGITDDRFDWRWGAGHLVIIGDVFDKGPGVTESLWLIRKLERQARAAGGAVHYLLGNHDYLALSGASQRVSEKYRRIAARLRVAYQELYGPDTELGRWVRARDTVLKINDRLFVHGGISPGLLAKRLSLAEINRLVRVSLAPAPLVQLNQQERDAAAEVVQGDGPLWYRGYFDSAFPFGFASRLRGNLKETQPAVAAIDEALAWYGCRQIVVGHTYTRQIRQLYGGKLVTICLDLHGFDRVTPDSKAEMLLIERDRLSRVSLDGSVQRF